ncbi:hypothetical protein JYU34_007494 [Plutella xylostella]|uniref:Uncharacterized protein n=1 Tax=Plutella xylostella TaxID=51655 RepID=A0ABQ7QQJ5_PLUXY|nr:hypothetical protein JYU34_007494 [Plutella xylostella]
MQSDPVWAALSAELAGTALLVLLSCVGAAGGAAAAGLVVATLIQCFDHISGAHFNPVVTLCAVVRRRVPPTLGAMYVAAQLLGASAGAAAVCGAPGAGGEVGKCVTRLGSEVTTMQGLLIEGLLGALLALANCASWDPRNRRLPDSWPLRMGAIVAGLVTVAGPLTGAGMNPARSFGPALLAHSWGHHWVYWLGPLGGSLLASLLYTWLWHSPPDPPARGDDPPAPLEPSGKEADALVDNCA